MGSSTGSHHGTWHVFLEDVDLRPHKSKYWLNPKTKDSDPEGFAAEVQAVCDAYEAAGEIGARGGHVVSCDEKTGMQALERIAPTMPPRPGLIERFEFEYTRHGTLCLTANFDVVTGKVVSHTIAGTRTEIDFADHVASTVSSDPLAEWVFVADQLNTHKSATLVERVAAMCGITDDLGVKGEHGILKTMESRAAFLSDPTHRIRFVYTPKHCSWLNQVEIWFSVLARRLLKRSSFSSLDDLRSRVDSFIAYFNATMAKPYRWTYTGRALRGA